MPLCCPDITWTRTVVFCLAHSRGALQASSHTAEGGLYWTRSHPCHSPHLTFEWCFPISPLLTTRLHLFSSPQTHSHPGLLFSWPLHWPFLTSTPLAKLFPRPGGKQSLSPPSVNPASPSVPLSAVPSWKALQSSPAPARSTTSAPTRSLSTSGLLCLESSWPLLHAQ